MSETSPVRPTESAVLVPIPEAESVVGSFRASLDSAAGLGVPAHVTVISPFVPPERIDDVVITALAAAITSVPAFDVTFARIRWFGQQVLWLAPDPAGPFIALTAAVWRAFPSWPPYGGAYDETVPHLTVGIEQPVGGLETAAGGPDTAAGGPDTAAGRLETAAGGLDTTAGRLETAARAIEPGLPFTARVSTAVLMQGSARRGSWRTVAELPLGVPAAR